MSQLDWNNNIFLLLILSRASVLATEFYIFKGRREAIYFSINVLLDYSHLQLLLEKRMKIQLDIEFHIYTCSSQQAESN